MPNFVKLKYITLLN